MAITNSSWCHEKKKNKLYTKSIKHKCLHNETVYKNYRNCLKKLLKAAKKKYYNDLISKYKTILKKWSIIKTSINKNEKSLNQKEFKLGDGSLASDMKLICNKFNESFINVGPSLSKKIPTQNTVPTEYIKNKAVYSLYLEPVSESEIKLISSLKSNTPGYGMIGSAVLKWCVDFIFEPLSHYVICLYKNEYFQMNKQLQMLFPCINVMIPSFSIITDLYLFFLLYQRYLKELCIIGLYLIWMNTKFCFPINLDSEKYIQPIWHWWHWWIN